MKKLIIGFLILAGTTSLVSYNKVTNNVKALETINHHEYNTSKEGMHKLIYSRAEITMDEAKNIALKHANLKSEQVQFIKTSKEIDDGILKYEIDFKVGNKKYEYDIDPKTGEILKADYELEKSM